MGRIQRDDTIEDNELLDTGPLTGEEGQSLAEYTLIVVFIALACVAALTALGPIVAQSYQDMVGFF